MGTSAQRPLPAAEWCDGHEEQRHGVAFATLGCRVNQAETEEALDALVQRGFRLSAEHARLAVVNTCAVTADAVASSRKLIRRTVARNPDALVVVTGCYATLDPAAVGAIDGVDLVVANHDKPRLAELVLRAEPALAPTPAEALVGADADDAIRRLHTRVSIRVQTGCDEHCAFCIIPRTRGPLRSRPADEIIAEVRRRVADGVREVVLTGVHLGKYGADLDGGPDLAQLLRRLLAEIPELERVRLSSILPRQLTDELIGLVASDRRLCRHLHVPLQSGSDRILRRMGRSYDVATFLDRVETARRAVPGLGLSTDVIVGFPGETETDFAATLEVVEQAQFSKLHVFRYSPRPGTRSAETMPDDVPAEVKRDRARRLIALGETLRQRFHASLLGSQLEVVVERVAAPGWVEGTADNYVRVVLRGDADDLERTVPVRVVGLRGTAVVGERDASVTPPRMGAAP